MRIVDFWHDLITYFALGQCAQGFTREFQRRLAFAHTQMRQSLVGQQLGKNAELTQTLVKRIGSRHRLKRICIATIHPFRVSQAISTAAASQPACPWERNIFTACCACSMAAGRQRIILIEQVAGQMVLVDGSPHRLAYLITDLRASSRARWLSSDFPR